MSGRRQAEAVLPLLLAANAKTTVNGVHGKQHAEDAGCAEQ